MAIKKLADEFNAEHPILLYTDLHGHSRTRQAFMYGNNYPKNPESTRLYPYILSKIERDMISFSKCRFKVEKYKDGTSRVQLWKSLKVPAIYTLEVSLCGGSLKSSKLHYNSTHLMSLGTKLCLALVVYGNVHKHVIKASPESEEFFQSSAVKDLKTETILK